MSLCVTRLSPLCPIHTPIAPRNSRAPRRMMQLSTVTWLVSSPGLGALLSQPCPIFTPPAPMSWMYVRSTRQSRQPRWNQTPYVPIQPISQSSSARFFAASAVTAPSIRTAAWPSLCPPGGRT